MEKIIYDDVDYIDECVSEFEIREHFEDLFDNKYENKTYIVRGDVGLWDGVQKNVHHPRFFDSIADAIREANDGFSGYITVSDINGQMLVEIEHHDGYCYLEIRELTDIGEEMRNNYASVGDVINKKGATKNVEFCSRYM